MAAWKYISMHSAQSPATLPPGTHLIGWVGPRAGLDVVKWRKVSYRESNPEPLVIQSISYALY
jgi:hypothetical protein